MRHVNLTAINFDSATQIRAEIDDPTVNAYAEAMAAGEKFPPATLFKDGERYIIGDGWHRLLAAQKNGDVTFPCTIGGAGRREAIRFALSANAKHGLPRSNADKRKSVEIALREFPKLSDRTLAEMCAVSHTTVQRIREDQVAQSATSRNGKDGKTYSVPSTTKREKPPVPPAPVVVATPPPPPTVVAGSLPVVMNNAVAYVEDPPSPAVPWSLPRFGEKLRAYLEGLLEGVPAEHVAEAKWLGRQISGEVFVESAEDPKPEPFGDRRTIPPLPEWVTAYSASIGYPMDGQAWCDGYQQKGWVVGKTKMKDWQSACRNWKTNGWGLGAIALDRGKSGGSSQDYSKI